MENLFRVRGVARTFVLAAGFALMSFVAHAGGGKVHEVEIKKFKFIPPEITIQAGDTVRWVNNEKRQYHSIWFESLGEEESETFFPDENYERTFDKPGTYRYRCGPHEEMTGVIHVQ